MKTIRIVSLLLITLGFVSCVSNPISPERRYKFQRAEYATLDEKKLMKTFREILISGGAVVETEDVATKKIVASLPLTRSGKVDFPLWEASAKTYRRRRSWIVVQFTPMLTLTTEARMSIQLPSLNGEGGEEILDETIYQSIFDRVRRSVVSVQPPPNTNLPPGLIIPPRPY